MSATCAAITSRAGSCEEVTYICPRILFLMQESREEWALPSPKIKAIGVQRWDHSLSGAVVGLQEHAEFCSHSLSQPLGMQRILSPVKPHLACLSWAGLRRCYRKNPPLLFIEAWQMGQRRRVSSGCWGDAVLRSLVQVHYLLMKTRCHAVVSTAAWLQISQWGGVSSVLTKA